MATRYCVEQIGTGLYWHEGQWAEEPEWFTAQEANNIVRAPYMAREPSPLAVRAFEFDPTTEE